MFAENSLGFTTKFSSVKGGFQGSFGNFLPLSVI
jgi:hypothetical protein